MIDNKKNQSKIAIIELVGAYGGMEIYDLSIMDGLSQNLNTIHLYTTNYFSKLRGVDFDKVKMIFGEIYSKDRCRLIRYFMVILGFVRLVKALVKNPLAKFENAILEIPCHPSIDITELENMIDKYFNPKEGGKS